MNEPKEIDSGKQNRDNCLKEKNLIKEKIETWKKRRAFKRIVKHGFKKWSKTGVNLALFIIYSVFTLIASGGLP